MTMTYNYTYRGTDYTITEDDGVYVVHINGMKVGKAPTRELAEEVASGIIDRSKRKK